MFEGLRKPTELIVIVVTLLAFGCPVQAIVHAFDLDERTVARLSRSRGLTVPTGPSIHRRTETLGSGACPSRRDPREGPRHGSVDGTLPDGFRTPVVGWGGQRQSRYQLG
jgi:hypothetical protein